MRRAHLLLCLAGISGCVELDEFDVDRSIDEQRIPGSPLAGLLGSLFEVPIPMEIDLESETAARDTGPARAVRVRELWLEVTPTAEAGSDTDDFGFLDSVDVFIESAREGSALPRARIATAHGLAPSRRIDFEVVESVNVLPYAEQGARLVSEAAGSAPPDDVTFVGRYTLRVEVF